MVTPLTRQLLLCLMVLAFSTYGEPKVPVFDWLALRDDVRILRAELTRQGAYAFVTNAETTPRVAPYIHSRYWVDRLPDSESSRRAYEQEKRDFGFDFIVELEKIALAELPFDDLDGLEQRTDEFLTMAEWLKTSLGYGNYMLKRWCEGIAETSLGTMAVNSQCPVGRAERLFLRVDDLQACLHHQLAILEEEAPHHYRMPPYSDENQAQENLERQWGLHLKEAYDYYNARHVMISRLSFSDVKKDPNEYAFYIDELDSPIQYLTLRNHWNRKLFFIVCIYGLYDNMHSQIQDILTFRTKVGDIPIPQGEMTVVWSKEARAYLTLISDQWNHSAGEYMRNDAATAASLIYCHDFLDVYSRQLKWQREREQLRISDF